MVPVEKRGDEQERDGISFREVWFGLCMSTDSELGRVWICAVREELDIADGSDKVSDVKNFETGRSTFCSDSDGEGHGYMEVDDDGGTSSSRNERASDLETRSMPSPFTIISILFPTTTQQ